MLTGTKNGETPKPQSPEKTALALVPVTNNRSQQLQNKGDNNNVSNNTGETKNNTNPSNPLNQQITIFASIVLILIMIGAFVAVTIVKKGQSQTGIN